jgi:hypothetical protein
MRATRSSSMRFTEPQGRTEDPLVQPRRSTQSSAPPSYTHGIPSIGLSL